MMLGVMAAEPMESRNGGFVLAALPAKQAQNDRPAAPSLSIPTDRELREEIVGVWQDFYQGKRTMTLRADGSATMLVELSGWKARMFTRLLRLEMTWQIEGGKLHRRTVGGEPADKVEFVNRRVGDRCAEPILQLTEDRLVLLDQDGKQQYDWRRVK